MRALFLALILLFTFTEKEAWPKFYSEGEFREIFLKEFKVRFSNPQGEVVLERFKFEPGDLAIPKGTSYRVEWIGVAKAGSNTALLKFKLQGGEERIVRLWGYVEVKVPVVVVSRDLSARKILEEKDLLLERRELSRLPYDVLFRVEEALGQETRMSLKAGTVLRSSHLSQPLLVRRNQEVEILAQGRNFTIKAKGIALQNGRLEQYISVKNISSQKVVQAKVIGEGKVEVSF